MSSNTYTVQVDKALSANTVEARCKHEAISTVLAMLSYSYTLIMPYVDTVDAMAWHERHITYYAYIVPNGSLYIECRGIEEVRE